MIGGLASGDVLSGPVDVGDVGFESRFIILVRGGTHRLAEPRDPERERPVVPLPAILSVGNVGVDEGEGVEGGDRDEDVREEESEDGGEGAIGTFSRGDMIVAGFGDGNGGKKRSIII